MQLLWKPIIYCGGSTDVATLWSCFHMPISWRGCWAVLLPGMSLSRCPGRVGHGCRILAVLALESELLLTLETQSGCFLTSAAQFGSTGSLSALGSAVPALQLTSTQPCADRLVTHSLRQLLRILVCSLFSTAWKDILILYAYRKCGKLSEHLLFINLASYCCIKVINGKTEAQSN